MRNLFLRGMLREHIGIRHKLGCWQWGREEKRFNLELAKFEEDFLNMISDLS